MISSMPDNAIPSLPSNPELMREEGGGGGLFEQKISRPEGQLGLEEVVSVSRVNEIFMRSFNARYSSEKCFSKQTNKIIKKKTFYKELCGTVSV